MVIRARTSVQSIEPLESRTLLASYYVSATGSDNADGLSPATAWKTIARVNSHDFNPGDALLFEGGQTFAAVGSTAPNILNNPSFENSLESWTDTRGTSPANSVVTSVSHSGSGALVINGAGAGARAQDITASLAPGQTYKMSAWVRVEKPGAGIRRIGVTFYRDGQPVATHYRGFRNTAWAQTNWAFTAPPQFDRAVAWISRSGDNSAMFVDDLSIGQIPSGIVFNESDSGTTIAPVVIASYGAGKATINAGDGNGFWGENVAGVRIQNLNFTGSWNSVTASGPSAGVGIDFLNTRSDNSKLEFVTVEKCDVSGFQWAGVRVGGWAAKSGFRLAFITDTIARGNGDNGILIRGEFDVNSTLYSHEKVYVARCKVYSNSGISDRGTHSGSGVQMTDTFMGTVERCVVHHNGDKSKSESGGPVGIWAFDASKITLQYNESYENKTGNTRDGAGFDFDSGVTQSVMQNNYSHDNDGAGFLLGQFTGGRPWGRNIVRNNISQNDGRKNAYGAITLSGAPGPYNLVIENNTIFTSAKTGATPSGIRLKYAGTGVSIRNNIVYTSGNIYTVDADKNAAFAQFNGNAYYNAGGGVKIRWSGVTHTSLETWRSAVGREVLNNIATGTIADPQLLAPGAGGAIGNAYKLITLTQYKLAATSPLIGAAVEVTSNFKGYTRPTVDFFGYSQSGPRREVGAAEFVV